MHRFYAPPETCLGETVTLSGPEAHHALDVLRMRRGDELVVLDGAGKQLRCVIQGTAQHHLALRLIEKRETPLPRCQITLVQALPKGKLIETIVQKATELGALRVVPLISERVVARPDPADYTKKREKWQAAAIEAIKQCGMSWLPKVEQPATLTEFLARGERSELGLTASLGSSARHPRHWFKQFEDRHHRKPASVCLWIGPEGDFTPDELASILAAGAHPITLGPNVLRTDTAAVFCLSMANYELQAP